MFQVCHVNLSSIQVTNEDSGGEPRNLEYITRYATTEAVYHKDCFDLLGV